MKIVLFCITGLLLILGAGFVWHMHSPLPFLPSSQENSELPAEVSPDGGVGEVEPPALPITESPPESTAGNASDPTAPAGDGAGEGNPSQNSDADDFSIEIISGMGESSGTVAD